jgi:hypothetical protein
MKIQQPQLVLVVSIITASAVIVVAAAIAGLWWYINIKPGQVVGNKPFFTPTSSLPECLFNTISGGPAEGFGGADAATNKPCYIPKDAIYF